MKVASQNFTKLHHLGSADLQEIMPKPDSEKIRETLTHRNPQVAARELDKIRKQLEELPTFGKHAPAVNAFFSGGGGQAWS
jgi:hypothetical protein